MPDLADDRFSALRGEEPERPDLPATEVRRRGDGRRRRRNLATVAGSTLAMVLVVGGATALTRSHTQTAPEPAPAPTSTPSPAPTTIPADVPLDAGLPQTNLDGTPVEVTSSPGVDPLSLCGNTLFGARAALDAAGVSYSGGEDSRGRTLLLFGSPEEASAILGGARDAVTACPSSDDDLGTLLAESVRSTLGEESIALLTQYENEGPLTGPTVHHLVRIGSSVLITSQAGEASNTREGLAAYADAATTAAEEVVAAITGPAGQTPGAE